MEDDDSDRPTDQDGRPFGITRRRFIALVAVVVAAGAAGWELLRGPGGGAAPGPTPASSAPLAQGSAVPVPSAEPSVLGPEETGPIETGPPEGPNRVSRENTRAGSTRWELPLAGTGGAQGYFSDVSVVAGDSVSLHLDSAASLVTVTAYRIGWYGGAGGRLVGRWRDIAVEAQPEPATDPVTGMVWCDWHPALEFPVPADWVSGLYLFLLEPKGLSPQYVPLWVREAKTPAPILFLSSMTTFQAYNQWGGKSLYPDGSTGATTVSGGANAVTVSYDRPYDSYRGGGRCLRWEPQFIRWIEAGGYDLAYAADMDLERHPELFQGRKLIIVQGHAEYWSVGMRRTLEAAIAAGTNVAFFSANEIYWRCRFENSVGGKYRSVTCYRLAAIDPLASTDPAQATTKWRELPSRDPESLVIGQMYGHVVSIPADFICSRPDHWIYQGTGMQAGDGITNLVGQEYDRFYPDPALHPPGTQVLAISPVLPTYGHAVDVDRPPPSGEPASPVQNATIYTAPSGATVFSAGTIQWSWGLDDWGNQDYDGVHTPVDPRAQAITANILDRLGG